MNFPLAIECADLIQQVYRSNFEPTISVPETDTQVQVVERAAGIWWIIFPGTASLQDWRTDVKVRKTDWLHEGRVHRGFLSAYESVMKQIVGHVATAKRIVITGHSLGGALATLCADDLTELGWDVATVITFGSPRVGNGPFARDYNSKLADRTLRFVNAGDPVPHVPWFLGTYRHVNTQVYLDRAGQAVVAQPFQAALSEWQQTIESVANKTNVAQAVSVAAHSITSYLSKLKQLA